MIRPNECNQLNGQEVALLKAMEQTIDDQLRAKFSPGGRVSISVQGLPERVRLRVIEVYRHGGWTVEYTDDQRDGAYLNFTAAP